MTREELQNRAPLPWRLVSDLMRPPARRVTTLTMRHDGEFCGRDCAMAAVREPDDLDRRTVEALL